MGLKLSKVVGVAVLGVVIYLLCRFLQVEWLLPTGLAVWGMFCFLFSFELAGSKKRVRDGIEERTILHLFWILAGVLCMLMAGGVIFVQS